MDAQLHLALHQARIDDALRRHERLAAQRPRPPGLRHEAARALHRLANRLEPAPEARHA